MKIRRFAWLIAVCLLPALILWSQPPDDADEPGRGSRIRSIPLDNSLIFSWWGKTGETYFIQLSPDLTSGWQYIDEIYSGQNALIEHGFSSNAAPLFFRLRYTDEPTPDPENADFDGDGVSNIDELAQGTNPFLSLDSDGDGIPDDWEIFYGLDPEDPADAGADPDEDGFDNRTEYLARLNPYDATNGVSSASIDPVAPGRPTVIDGPDLTTATLVWTDHSNDELMFQIQRATNGGPYEVVTTLPADTTTWTDTGLDPSNIYYYRIASLNNASIQ